MHEYDCANQMRYSIIYHKKLLFTSQKTIYYFCICVNTFGKSISRATLSIPPSSGIGGGTAGPALTFGVYFAGEFSLDSSKSIIIIIKT